MTRQVISKKLRFEIFKRDSFRCQYCGASAPEVLLHLDHLKPIAESLAANLVALINQLHQKSAIRLPAFKVAASTQHQFLIHGRLESVVTLLHVAVLVGLTRLGAYSGPS